MKRDPHESKMANTTWNLPGGDGLCTDCYGSTKTNNKKTFIQSVIPPYIEHSTIKQEIQVPFDMKTTISFNNTKKVDFSQLARYSVKPSAVSPDELVAMCGYPIDLVSDEDGVIVENTPSISGYKRGCWY